jgi:peptide-methionine (S)-S-oxide reductase
MPGGIVLVPKRPFLVRSPMRRLKRTWLSWPILMASVVPGGVRPFAPTARAGEDAAARVSAGTAPVRAPLDTAIFAGGCFWSMVGVFDAIPGVVSVLAGYTGGALAHPSYSQVSSGGTGHAEAVRVEFDPDRIGYPALLRIFWRNVDPLDASGQFCDRGEQYRSEIFYRDSAQKEAAEESDRAVRGAHLPGAIVTQVVHAGPFYPAEAYHQGYHRTHPVAYAIYRWGCGRDRRLHEIWGASAGANTSPGANSTIKG